MDKSSKSWETVIEEALHTCDKLLLIVSPDLMKAENVADEWSSFLELGKPVYPFIYKESNYKESNMSFLLRHRPFTTSTGDLLADVARTLDYCLVVIVLNCRVILPFEK